MIKNGSRELRERYGHATLLVLAFSGTAAQRQTLMRHTTQALWQVHGRHPHLGAIQTWYAFASQGDAHPLRIATAWQRIKEIIPHAQRLPSGGLYERVTVEAEGWRWLG